jgi:hypothetical protein
MRYSGPKPPWDSTQLGKLEILRRPARLRASRYVAPAAQDDSDKNARTGPVIKS